MVTSDELVANIANTLRELKGRDLELVAIEVAIQLVLAQMSTILRVDDIINDAIIEREPKSPSFFALRAKQEYQRSIFGQSCIEEINQLRSLKQELETLKLTYNGDSITQ